MKKADMINKQFIETSLETLINRRVTKKHTILAEAKQNKTKLDFKQVLNKLNDDDKDAILDYIDFVEDITRVLASKNELEHIAELLHDDNMFLVSYSEEV